jgi:hypothetical protein
MRFSVFPLGNDELARPKGSNIQIHVILHRPKKDVHAKSPQDHQIHHHIIMIKVQQRLALHIHAHLFSHGGVPSLD